MAAKKEVPASYRQEVTSIPDSARNLLEKYSGIPPDKVLHHVQAVRDNGLEIFSYACLGQLRFLDHIFHKSPYYAQVVERLHAGATLLDAGCCFGQELRYLIDREQIRSDQLFGFDLEPKFLELGYELFRDGERLGATLVKGDLSRPLDSSFNSDLAKLQGRISIVYVASVLHLFTWDDMLVATKRLIELTEDKSGTMIVGNQMGSSEAGEYAMPFGKHWRHNPDSMQKFWEQVGLETGTTWKLEVETYISSAVTDNRDEWWSKSDPGMCMIGFCATRV